MTTIPQNFDYALSKYNRPLGGTTIPRGALRAFEGLVPDDYLEFLGAVGTGVWLEGRFQIVDPRKYAGVIDLIFSKDADFPASEIVAIGLFAFGGLYVWSQRFWRVNVDVLLHTVTAPDLFGERAPIGASRSLANGLALVDSRGDANDEEGKPLFKRALKAYDPLLPDQIYAPRLHPALGGSTTLDNFRPASAPEALSLAVQAAPFVLKDVLGRPPKPSRVIGG